MSDAYGGLHLTFVRCVQNSFMETDIKLLGRNEFSWVDFSKTPGLEGILLGKLLGKHKIKVRPLMFLNVNIFPGCEHTMNILTCNLL